MSPDHTIERGLSFEVEVTEALDDGKLRELEIARDGAVVAFGQLIVEQPAEQVAETPLAGGCFGGDG